MEDEYIKEFIAEISPEAPELYMAMFNEKKCLKDATELIRELRAKLSEAEWILRELHGDPEPDGGGEA